MRSYTFHTDFLAEDDEDAHDLAMAYAEGMIAFRAEVEARTARISPAGDWTVATEIHCNAPSGIPDEVCTDRAGHQGGCSWTAIRTYTDL